MKQQSINLDEAFGKIVGTNVSAAADYDRLVEAAEKIMPRLPFPKGVYRFRSFEEADAWTEHYILKAAREKNRARQDIPDRTFLRTLLEIPRDSTEARKSGNTFLDRIRKFFGG